MVSVGKDRDLRVWVEDVDEQALQQRRVRLVQHHQRQHGGEMNGYAVDEDEDMDAQIMEMEGGGHDHMEVEVNGAGNGHAMEVDAAA